MWASCGRTCLHAHRLPLVLRRSPAQQPALADVGFTRGIRQHANPFSPLVVGVPAGLPPPFVDPTLPLHLDLGTGDGQFLAAVAARQRGFNHIGTEIRAPVVERAQALVADPRHPASSNACFLRTNFTESHALWFPAVLAASRGGLAVVSILNPDPCWKARHAKRRMLSPKVLGILAGYTQAGARLYLQTDRPEVIEDMHAVIAASGGGCWERLLPDPTGPYAGVHSPREVRELDAGSTIYRAMYTRTEVEASSCGGGSEEEDGSETRRAPRYRLGAPPPQRAPAASGEGEAVEEAAADKTAAP